MFPYVTTLILDKKGRIVIPQKVREEMGLGESAAVVLGFEHQTITIKKGKKQNDIQK